MKILSPQRLKRTQRWLKIAIYTKEYFSNVRPLAWKDFWMLPKQLKPHLEWFLNNVTNLTPGQSMVQFRWITKCVEDQACAEQFSKSLQGESQKRFDAMRQALDRLPAN